ncbi:MAG: hypothetical protein RSC00_08095, partial [Ruthenibacterium sp.]
QAQFAGLQVKPAGEAVHPIQAQGTVALLDQAAGTVDQMMAVNNSVQGILGAVSNLEIILQNKLSLFSCRICPCA